MTAFSIANLTVSNNTITVLRSIAQDLARSQQAFSAVPQPITPAAAPVADQLRNQLNLNQVQQQALTQSSAIIGVSIKGVTDITKTLSNLRQIVTSAAQPGVSNDQLQALAQQFNQGLASIQSSLKGASLAGIDLLNGTNTQNFLANGLSPNDLRTLNLQTGVLDVLTANSLQNALSNPPDPFANLVNGIVSAVKAQFGGTSDATARSFANQFIDQIGRGNPTQVLNLGNQLINSLNGTAPGNEGTRQLVDHALDAIANGAPQTTVSDLIGGVINTLANSGQGQGDGEHQDNGQGNGNNNVQGGDNQGQGNAFAFGQTGDVGRGRGDGGGDGGGGSGGGGSGGGSGPPDLTGVLSGLDKALAAATNSLTVLNRENQFIKDQSNSLSNLNSTLNSQVGALVNTNLTSARAQVLAQQIQSALGAQIISITGDRARSVLHGLFDNAAGAGAGTNTAGGTAGFGTNAASAGNLSNPLALANPFPTLSLLPPQTNLFNIQA